MRMQLRQDRAYVVLDALNIKPNLLPGSGKLKSYSINASLKNSGHSPAIDAEFLIRIGVTDEGYEERLEFRTFTKGTKHILGQNCFKLITQDYPREFIEQCFDAEKKLSGYVYIAYKYSDIYKNSYLAEFTNIINWSTDLLRMSNASLTNAKVETFLSGSKNGEAVLFSCEDVR